jgi:hypothetical protein
MTFNFLTVGAITADPTNAQRPLHLRLFFKSMDKNPNILPMTSRRA